MACGGTPFISTSSPPLSKLVHELAEYLGTREVDSTEAIKMDHQSFRLRSKGQAPRDGLLEEIRRTEPEDTARLDVQSGSFDPEFHTRLKLPPNMDGNCREDA